MCECRMNPPLATYENADLYSTLFACPSSLSPPDKTARSSTFPDQTGRKVASFVSTAEMPLPGVITGNWRDNKVMTAVEPAQHKGMKASAKSAIRVAPLPH